MEVSKYLMRLCCFNMASIAYNHFLTKMALTTQHLGASIAGPTRSHLSWAFILHKSHQSI